MNTPLVLLSLLLSLHVFYAGGWALAGVRLGLQRSAAMHWAGYCLALAAGLGGFYAMHVGLPRSIGVPLANLALVAASILVRRGLARFGHYPSRDVEHAGVLIAGALMLGLSGSSPDQLVLQTVLMSLLIGYVMLRMGGEMAGGIRREFGIVHGWLLSGPVLVLGVGLMLRAAAGLWHADRPIESDITTENTANVGMLFLLVVASTLFQLSLGYLMILRLVRRLRELSHHDALTSLLNRRAWAEALERERQRLRRKAGDTTLLVLDIDHFKRLNDQHGHAAGDAALVGLAHTLRAAARGSDVVARLGGEEFGVLLPDTDAEGALHAAERMRDAAARLSVMHEDQTLQLTISIGVAVVPAGVARLHSLEQLQRRADEALYRAKAEGRNRIVLHTVDGHTLRLAAERAAEEAVADVA